MSIRPVFRRFLWLAPMLPALLTGCARYVAHPIDPRASATALTARRLDDHRLLVFLRGMGHPEPRWGITTLTLVAVYERPDLRIATARYAIAKGGLTAASALPNPVLGLSPTYNTAAGLPSPIKVGPIVNFLISSFGARSAGIAAARSDVVAARAAIQTAAWQEHARVRNALMAVWLTRAQAALATRAARDAAANQAALSQRFAAGMVSAPSLDLARLSTESAQFSATEATRHERIAEIALATAIGMPASALRGINLDLSAFDHAEAPVHLRRLAREALVDRPAVRAALARYEATQDRLRAAIDGQYPAFTIGPGYHYDQGSNKFLLALSLPLPIFNQHQGPIAIARAKRRLAAGRFQAVQQHVLDTIETARTDWRASHASTIAAERAASSAARREIAAETAFRAGATGRLRLLEARQAKNLAGQNVLAARGQALRALGNLEDALHHIIFESPPQ